MDTILSLLKNDMSYAILFVVLAGLIRGFAGFGASMAMIPPLSALFSPEKAVAIVASIETIGTMQLLPSAFKNADFKYFTVPNTLVQSYALSVRDFSCYPTLLQRRLNSKSLWLRIDEGIIRSPA